MLNLIRHRLQRLSWIAALAIFGLVCLPTLSRALAHADALAMAEVCTMESMAPASAVPGDPTLPEHAGGHCPLCLLSAGAVGLLPAQVPAWRLPPLPPAALPRLFLLAPRPLFAWASVQPRAPPPPV